MKAWDSHAITKAFADAAVDPTLWVKAMDIIARETGSFGALLLPVYGQIPNPPASDSLLRGMENYIGGGWYLRDERLRGIKTMIKFGVYDDFDCLTAEEMKRNPYYQEFLRPSKLHSFAGVKMAAADDLWCVAIQRSPKQVPFSAEEKQELAALSRQLSSAAALARALGFTNANAAVEAFEVGGVAVALLNRRGEVLRFNRAAEKLLGAEVRLFERRIVSSDRDATAALERALRELLRTATSSALLPPILLPRRDRRPIVVYPVRLSTLSVNVFGDCQALLVFVDLDQRPRPPEQALHSSFALTAAEARIAIRMASGAGLAAVADELHISKETARSQLKAVFVKAGVSRQAELVALLASFLSPEK
jgi:DNA-binding CsgD family transcriptional regulator/PAS domain-containing protein